MYSRPLSDELHWVKHFRTETILCIQQIFWIVRKHLPENTKSFDKDTYLYQILIYYAMQFIVIGRVTVYFESVPNEHAGWWVDRP